MKTLLTTELKTELTRQINNDVKNIKSLINFIPNVIADIGANVGYYTNAFLSEYPLAIVHSYEPQPDNLVELHKIKNERLYIHEYGLFDSNKKMNIGMRDDNRYNNGTYGIYTNINSIEVLFKNANEEIINADLVKMDVEGSELYILQCNDFFKSVKAIIVELVYLDNFNQNENIRNQLKYLGFEFSTKLNKNDELWIKNSI